MLVYSDARLIYVCLYTDTRTNLLCDAHVCAKSRKQQIIGVKDVCTHVYELLARARMTSHERTRNLRGMSVHATFEA